MHQYLIIERSRTARENEYQDLHSSRFLTRRCKSAHDVKSEMEPYILPQRLSHYQNTGHINLNPGFESPSHKGLPVDSGTP